MEVTLVTTVVIVNPYEIKHFKYGVVVNPSKFILVGKKLHRLAKTIQKEWHNFEEEDKDLLIKLAYDLIEPNNSIWKFPQQVWSFVYLLIIKITGQEREFLFCVDAIDGLVDTILDAIEQENKSYQEVLSDTLKEVRDNPEIGEFVDAKQGSQWLRDLSDKAFREI
ncbi:hypothetical protein NO758_01375 [Planktothrix agardhii]|uniref:Uncharacterized protein n=1 Tax=Planktothrix rubescens CCAP 1459/22 TaxID=329571 RepID=A0A6J7ZSL1_PLARU|nr:conserved hypothetical protein [Planktothrix rubescens NIVA-CYA 18]CAD0228419.1 conserved hypothetical protein [Planktothrix agardhii]CAD5932648.1 hypothetical protein NO758_01375 [Planktothrix agardhii]CAD5959850.1 hypothetical protein PCC7821_03091 [Planktothrix rubescens NIVA-CYA 18]